MTPCNCRTRTRASGDSRRDVPRQGNVGDSGRRQVEKTDYRGVQTPLASELRADPWTKSVELVETGSEAE